MTKGVGMDTGQDAQLTPGQRERIERLIEISRERGIDVVLSEDGMRVELRDAAGNVVASSPVSDFAP